MSRRLRYWAVRALIISILLCGCQPAPGAVAATKVSDRPFQWPELSPGLLKCEELPVLHWDAGRLEDTSGYRFAETENGFYMVDYGVLFYAEKTDPSNWVLVCNRPDCDHLSSGCAANVVGSWVVEKDGRLYFCENVGDSPELYFSMKAGQILVSTALDGSDKQLAYVFEDALLSSGGAVKSLVMDGKWLCRVKSFDIEGITTVSLYQLDENGPKEVTPVQNESGIFGSGREFALYGEPCLYWGDGTAYRFYRFCDETLVSFDDDFDPQTGGYISGDTLRTFRENDGYYDIDLRTGEEVKIADPQLTDSRSAILLPNCIIETTLFSKNRTESSLMLFDGESWRPVALPKEWEENPQGKRMSVVGIASDCIFLTSRYDMVTTVYRILLGKDSLTLEYCGIPVHPGDGTA